MRKAIFPLLLVAAVGTFVLLGGAGGKEAAGTKYSIILDNAFGLTNGGDVKVGGVKAGKITQFGLDKQNHAKVDIQLTEPGFKQFTDQATCDTRPQSVIGEYFIDCQPGKGQPLKDGGVVPVSRTTGTVPIDLVNNILRLPERERLRIIIGELGAAVAGNGGNLNAALRRAVPALRETDVLLKLLGDESATIRNLVRDADTVVGDLARNKQVVVRFIRTATRTARLSAERRGDLQATFRKLPAFLRELRPTMVSLGRTADNTSGTLATLQSTSGRLRRFFRYARPFAEGSKPALRSLAEASVTGRDAVIAARPTVRQLARFTRKTPELATNLSFILRDLDDRKRAVENDPRAAVQIGRPGAKVGYTGLEALLMYVFNQSVAINAYDQNGHLLRVNGFVNKCAAYVDKKTRDEKLRTDPSYGACTSVTGPTQPGINAPDTSDKSLVASSGANDSGPGGGGGLPVGRRKAARGASASDSPSGPALPPSLKDLLGRAPKAAAPKPRAGATTPAAPSAPAPSSDDATSLLDYLLAP